SAATEAPEISHPPADRQGWRHSRALAALLVLIPLLFGAFLLVKRHGSDSAGSADPATLATLPSNTTRALPGSGRKPYVDRSGNLWLPNSSCSGGTSVKVPDQKIAGTEDPYL